jgi:hypothetical protein
MDIIMQISVYAGVPATVTGLFAAKEVLKGVQSFKLHKYSRRSPSAISSVVVALIAPAAIT